MSNGIARPLSVVYLPGLTPYAQAHQLQLETVDSIKKKRLSHTLYLLEHPPVITLGKNAEVAGIVAPPALLKTHGVEVHRIERGGQATYHCPGQLVGYPIMDLHELKIGVAKYVHLLEEVLIQTCAAVGVDVHRQDGLTGIFTNTGAKIGALGIRVTRGVSFHGFALNVCPDLSGYNMIVPCGLTDTPMAKLDSLVSPSPSVDDIKKITAEIFARLFQLSV